MASPDAAKLAQMSRSEVLRASPRMFESNFLDKFTRVHPAVPPILFLPAIAYLTYLGFSHVNIGKGLLLLVAGYVIWTLTEYWLHRIVFHFEPADGIGARLHWIIHGVHHDHPNDPMRLVMPPSVSVPISSLFCFGFYGIFGAPDFYLVSAAFLAGYLGYDMLHYHVHHHRPRTRLGKLMRELHMRHHFQDHDTGYGVSAPFWDHVFGTAPKARPVKPGS
jgi:sterol desaturase/sphingolipid hydroxylase (fatty acid hydroxylase superfamily)